MKRLIHPFVLLLLLLLVGVSCLAASGDKIYWVNAVGIAPEPVAPKDTFQARFVGLRKVQEHLVGDSQITDEMEIGDEVSVERIDAETWRVVHKKSGKAIELRVVLPSSRKAYR